MKINLDVETQGFKDYSINLNNDFNDVKFESSAQDKTIDNLLKTTFSQINNFDLTAKAKGEISDLNFDVNSSLGEKLEKAFGSALQAKIDEVNKQIKEKIDGEIGKIKGDIDKQLNQFKSSYSKVANDAESKLNSQKKLAEDKANQAKKDTENKAKDKIKEEGQKQLDDLKKKLGF